MISFYPGPSRVYDDIPNFVKDAHRLGILSMNHRSTEFMAIAEATVSLLKSKLSIPADYSIFFTSSATECWEIIAQSVVQKESIHLYNGAFGQKWFEYTQRLRPGAIAKPFQAESILTPSALGFNSGEVICITQNETSNATQVSNGIIKEIRELNPQHLVVVDATSSMGGIKLDFKAADIWFASVQKCFGLPAGLGVIVCSPRAMQRVVSVNENGHYNSLTYMQEMMARWQTPCTPNVLGIYLLMRVMKKVKPIGEIHKSLIKRQKAWVDLLSKGKDISVMIKNPAARSTTVIAVTGEEAVIDMIKRKARKSGFLIGEGYGSLKKTSFRIANFPALKSTEVQSLMRFMKQYL